MRLPLHPAGRQDREGQRDTAGLARLPARRPGGPHGLLRPSDRRGPALPRDPLRPVAPDAGRDQRHRPGTQGGRRLPPARHGHLDGQDRKRRTAPADSHHPLRRPRPPRLRDGTAARPPGGRPGTRPPQAPEHHPAEDAAAPHAGERTRPRRLSALPHRLRRRSRRRLLRPVPPRRRHLGPLPGRRLRQGRRRGSRHLPGPLHPARRCCLQPGPGRRTRQPQHRPQPRVPGNRPPLLHRRLRPAHPRPRPRRLPHHAGTADYLPTPGGQLIGALPNAHIATTTVHLSPGDTLLLHTDGLTEAHTTAAGGDDRYGDDALLDFGRDLAPTTASDTIGAVRDLLDAFGTGVDDDTAVLAIHVPRPLSEEQQ